MLFNKDLELDKSRNPNLKSEAHNKGSLGGKTTFSEHDAEGRS